MIRASMLGLLTLSLLAFGSLTAQQPDKDDPPPVLLKKKGNPDPKKTDDKKTEDKKIDDKKADEKKPAVKAGEKGEPKDEPEGGDAEAKAKEILARIAKDIDSAKERLKANDPGDATQQVQRDIVKGLDDLIDQMKNPPPQSDAKSNPGAGDQSKGQGGQSGQRSSSSRQRTARSKSGQQPGGGNPMAKAGQGEPQGSQSKTGQGQGGNQGGAGGTSPPGLDKLADTYKEIWGEYPFRERQEMDAYQKEGYMAKYRELLKQYYSTIAEKGRRPVEVDR